MAKPLPIPAERVVHADADEVSHHPWRLRGEIDARLVVLYEGERDLADPVSGAARKEEDLRVEREAVKALAEEKILRRLGGVRLAAALRVLHVGRHQCVNACTVPTAHEASPQRPPNDGPRDVTRRDRYVGALVDRADEFVDDLDRDREVSVEEDDRIARRAAD